MVQTWVDLPCFDGVYHYDVSYDAILEIEEKCKDGIGAIARRTFAGAIGYKEDEVFPHLAEYRFTELWHIIKQALLAGGKGWVDGKEVKVDTWRADTLMARYIASKGDDRMILTEVWRLALSIIGARRDGISPLQGFAPPGNVAAGESPATRTSR